MGGPDMAVYKRGTIWCVDYYITIDGKRERRREQVGTRKDIAEARQRECVKMVKSGIDPKTNRPVGEIDGPIPAPSETEVVTSKAQVPTLEEFVPLFLDLHGKRLSLKMQASYCSSLNHLLPVFGEMRLNEITQLKVRRYIAARKNDGVSNSTVNKEIACLKSALSRAVEWEYIVASPLQKFSQLREDPPRERYLTQEEAQRLIDASPEYLRNIIVFALGTGMRRSEIFSLKWDDVTLDEKRGTGRITVIGKGNKRRTIPVNETVYELLLNVRRKRTGYVFASSVNGKKRDNVKRSFASALKDAGIRNFRFHDLRHTAASWMVQRGVELYAVQKILGHANIATTQRYAHHSPRYLEEQIRAIDMFMTPIRKVS